MGEVTYKFDGVASKETLAALGKHPLHPDNREASKAAEPVTLDTYIRIMTDLSNAAEARQGEYRAIAERGDRVRERLIAITRTNNVMTGICIVVVVAAAIAHWVLG